MQLHFRLHAKSLIIVVTLLILAAFPGCSSPASHNTKQTDPSPAARNTAPVPSAAVPASGLPLEYKAPESRKIIETAQITLETRDLAATEKSAILALTNRQGKVDVANVSMDANGRRTGNYTLKVPAGQLQGYIAEVAALPDIIVRQRNISSQDVTEEFIDINARLENMQRHEVRLREILAKANTIEEILKVEKELATARGQIESTTARLKAMTGRIDMSTVQLRISEVTVVAESNFLGKLRGIVRDSWVAAGDVVLYLIATVIILSPLVILVAAIWWWWKRRSKLKQQPSA